LRALSRIQERSATSDSPHLAIAAPEEENFFGKTAAQEIPTPRWTAYDAKRFNVTMSDDVPMTTQERAYTSPIWYTP